MRKLGAVANHRFLVACRLDAPGTPASLGDTSLTVDRALRDVTVEWTASDGLICGFGEGGTVSLAVEGWRPGGRPPWLSGSVDAVAVGTTAAIRIPHEDVVLVAAADAGGTAPTGEIAGGPASSVDDAESDPSPGDGESDPSPDGGESDPAPGDGESPPSIDDGGVPLSGTELGAGIHRLSAETTPAVRVAFEGPATLDGSDRSWIRFSEPTAVAVGFRSTASARPTVTVPPTPAGLATAVTAAGGTHRTDGPARSHPGFRPRTPEVSFGPRSVPDGLLDGDRPTMTVPPSTAATLVAAPLAYYLGAALRVEPGPPRLDGDAVEHTFEPLPAFAEEVADGLRALVDLDVRLRSVPGESGPRQVEPDVEALGDARPVERLEAAMDAPPDDLPPWPLATYVDDRVDNGRYLPYVLDRLSLVHPAASSALDPQALLKRSLDEFYRGEAPNVEAVDPSLTDCRFHAWRGAGTPVDAYTLIGSPTSAPADHDVTIDVVCNEPAMADERAVADVYRDRLAGDDVEVRVHERLSRRELAAVFERRTDLVHFVGHCEVDGIRCTDGPLAADNLDRCRAAAFFLNACGSYYEGFDLVRRGATVGAVTLSAVLDEQAVTLGTTFAKLLAAGFAFDRALSLARGEIIVGRDYAVVGDGTHRLRPPYGRPAVFELQRDGDSYALSLEAVEPDGPGRRLLDPAGREHLHGTIPPRTFDLEATRRMLDRFTLPVRFEGELHWSDELADRLA